MFLQLLMKTARSLTRFAQAVGTLPHLLRQASAGEVERRQEMKDQVERLSKLH